VEIVYFVSYPLPVTHMIIGYSCLAFSFYETVMQGHGAAPITVKDKQIISTMFWCGVRGFDISVSVSPFIQIVLFCFSVSVE
jgi:hypothetical protein